jgi:type I restriction enzyme S subunit
MGNHWTTAKLGNLASVVASGVDKHVLPDERPVRLCNYLDVYRNRRLTKPYDFSVGSVRMSEAERFTIQKGDVIITKDSETPDDIGVPCLIADDFENTVCGYHLALIRPGKDLHPSFLSYLFQSETARRYFLAKAAGLTRFGLNPRTIASFPIPLPPHNEQAAIASVLDAVETAVEHASTTIVKAERLQKGLMQQLLTGRLKPDGTPRPKSEFWADAKLGLVPKGWMVEKGWKIAEKITKGQSPRWQGFDYTESGMLFVTSENVRDGFLDLSAPKFLPVEFNEKIKGSELRPGDVLINLVGASIGRSCIFDSDIRPANVNQAVCVFRPRPGIVSRYVAYYLRLHSTQNRLLSSQVETARSNLSLGDVRWLKFVLPREEDEQNEIAERLHQITRLVDAKKQKIAALQRLKKSLMQNLLTGRIRLPVNGAAKEAKS